MPFEDFQKARRGPDPCPPRGGRPCRRRADHLLPGQRRCLASSPARSSTWPGGSRAGDRSPIKDWGIVLTPEELREHCKGVVPGGARPQANAGKEGFPERAVRPGPRLGAVPRGPRRARPVPLAAGGRRRRLRSAGAPGQQRGAQQRSGSAWPRRRSSPTAPSAQHERYLRPLSTGEEIWCQLFSEPGAGSDLAARRPGRARRRRVGRQRAEGVDVAGAPRPRAMLPRPHRPGRRPSTRAHLLRRGHDAPGREVRPLRQITGEAEFNEVFLTTSGFPTRTGIGPVGEGWRVAITPR